MASPVDLTFEFGDIQFVLVETTVEVSEITDVFGAANLPEHKFIPIDVYRSIRETWKV